MLAHQRVVVTALLSLLALAAGCASKSDPVTAVKGDAGVDAALAKKSRPKTTPKTASIKSKGGKTPPAGAKSSGKQTRPKAGKVEVPITDKEVFTFDDVLEEGAAAIPFNWTYSETGGAYLWAAGTLTCNDGKMDPNGGYVMEVKDDGSGAYLWSLPACPDDDLYGCTFNADGTEGTCGTCGVEGDLIKCVADE